MSLDAAAAELQQRVRDGKMDGDAVRAVLDAAGTTAAPTTTAVSELTDRERQVLTLVAHGYATKQIAGELDIAYKTADRHIQNVYAKVGVHTRAAATMFAMRHRLV